MKNETSTGSNYLNNLQIITKNLKKPQQKQNDVHNLFQKHFIYKFHSKTQILVLPIMETQLDAAEPKSKENMINHTYTDFTLGHKEESIDLTFENVTYSVSQGFRKGEPPNNATVTHNSDDKFWSSGKRHILQGVNGRFPGKYLVAIMGPSGAGKSTLLDIVSGYRTTGIEGNVYVNGKQRDLNTFRR